MTEILRIIGRRRQPAILQTPIIDLRHPGSGREVSLVGTVHYAEPGYYTDITAAAIDRGIVLQEGTPPDGDTGDATDDERRAVRLRAEIRAMQAERVSDLGWVAQSDVLVIPEARRVDLTDLEIIRTVGAATMLTYLTRHHQALDWPDDDHTIRPNQYRVQIARTMRGYARARRHRRPSASPIDRVLVDARDALLLDTIAHLHQNTVLVWGTAHLPGLVAGLTAAGFGHRDTTWITAGYLPRITTALGHLLRGLPPAPHPQTRQPAHHP